MASYTVKSAKAAGTLVANLVIRKNTKFFTAVWTELVDQTPVKTGTARYSWIFTAVKPSSIKPVKRDYPRPALPDFWTYTYRWKNWYITNNQDYIQKLNNGHSTQNTNIGWIDSTVRRNVLKFNKGEF